MRRAFLLVSLLVALEREAYTSTFTSWQRSLPGMCVEVEISIGAHSDRGATENRLVRETKAQLDAVAGTIAPALQARLARYIDDRSPLVNLLAPAEVTPCLDASNADDPKHAAYADARRWSAPIALDTVSAMLPNRPMLAGVSSWRGVNVRLRLAKATDDALRAKIASDFIVAQFRGGPTPVADPSLTLDSVAGHDFAEPARSLFAALAVVARDRKAAITSTAPAVQALVVALDGKALPESAATIPEPLLIALWTTRETAQLAAWTARLDERGFFLDDRGDAVIRYLVAAGTPLPPLPAARWRARLAARDLSTYDAILHDLMKLHAAVADEDAMIRQIYDGWRARATYNGYENVIRVLLQLTFAQRRIAIADTLFVEAARLSSAPPAGYTAAGLLRDVFDHLWRCKQPLAPATVRALVDEAMRYLDEVAPAAISSLTNVPWSMPDRVALVTKLAACASCRATAAKSIRSAARAEKAATRAP